MGDSNELENTYTDDTEYFSGVKRVAVNKYLSGQINRHEYFTYLHLSQLANRFGMANVANEGLAADVLGSTKMVNTITAHLLKLKLEGLIDYPPRNGKRGTYRIKVEHFLISKGKFTKPGVYENQRLDVESGSNKEGASVEVGEEVDINNQRSKPSFETEVIVQDGTKKDVEIRGAHTNTDTTLDETIKTDYSITSKKEYKNKFKTAGFDLALFMREFGSLGYSEGEVAEVWEMAKNLHEEYMDFILIQLRDFGIATVEHICGLVKERVEDKTKPPVRNPGMYFNSLCQAEKVKRSSRMD